MGVKHTSTALLNGESKLAVAAVDRLTLVFLAAPCSLLNHFLTRLSESIAEVTTAAETHLGEHVLNV